MLSALYRIGASWLGSYGLGGIVSNRLLRIPLEYGGLHALLSLDHECQLKQVRH